MLLAFFNTLLLAYAVRTRQHANTHARAHTPLHVLWRHRAPLPRGKGGCGSPRFLSTYADVVLVMQVVNTVDRIVARAVRVIFAARGIFDVELRRVLPVRARRADL